MNDEYKEKDKEMKEKDTRVMLGTTRGYEGSGGKGDELSGGSGTRLSSLWQPDHVSDAMTSDRSDCRSGVAPR